MARNRDVLTLSIKELNVTCVCHNVPFVNGSIRFDAPTVLFIFANSANASRHIIYERTDEESEKLEVSAIC